MKKQTPHTNFPDDLDFEQLTSAWPNPITLTHIPGDTFLTLRNHQGYVEAFWTGHITADDVITASKVFLRLLKNTPSTGLLNDKSQVTGEWSEANDWLEFEWLPKVVELGLTCISHVYSENMFSRLSARDLQQRVLPPMQMRNFNDRHEAEHWMQECLSPTGAGQPLP